MFLILFFGASLNLVSAAEIANSEFGFRIVIPDQFLELEMDSTEPDTICKYADREPTPENPAVVIQMQRLRGIISVNSRMKPSEIPQVEGITTTLQEFRWKGLDLDVIRQTIKLPTGGIDYVVYGIQYPLSREAVQLQVGGPIQHDKEVYELFSQVAQSFSNTRPLQGTGDVAPRKLSTQERVEKITSGIVRLTLTAIVILFVFRFLKRALTKSKYKR